MSLLNDKIGVASAIATLSAKLTGITTTDDYDFYVSSLTGNDAYSGHSPLTPKRTLAAVLPMLSAGKKLGVQRGSHFRESLIITTLNTTVGVYGMGDRPIFDASDVVDPDSIVKTAGQANVYEFQAAGSDGNSGFPFSTFENNQRLKRVATLALCDSTAGSFFTQGTTDGQLHTVYVHPIDSTEPAVDGHTYEVAVRTAGIDIGPTGDATGVKLYSLHARRNLTNDGAMKLGARKGYASDCWAEDGTKHTLFLADGCLLEDCVAYKGEGYDSYIVYYDQDRSSDAVGSVIRRTQIIGGYAYGDEGRYQSANAVYAHGGNGILPRLDIENCYAENVSGGFGADAKLLNITNCVTYLCATSAAGASAVGQVVNITGCFFSQLGGVSYQVSNNEQRPILTAGLGTTNIKNNVLIGDGTYGRFLYSNQNDAVVNIENVVAICTKPATPYAFMSKDGTGKVTMRKCILVNNESVVSNYNTNLDLDSDYNDYFGSKEIKWGINGVDVSFSQRKASGQDTHSVLLDPGFTLIPQQWSKVVDAIYTTPAVVALLAPGN
jgi:hypothetical protein